MLLRRLKYDVRGGPCSLLLVLVLLRIADDYRRTSVIEGRLVHNSGSTRLLLCCCWCCVRRERWRQVLRWLLLLLLLRLLLRLPWLARPSLHHDERWPPMAVVRRATVVARPAAPPIGISNALLPHWCRWLRSGGNSGAQSRPRRSVSHH